MNAIISGQAGTAFLLDGAEAWTVELDAPETWVPRNPAEYPRIFDGATDIQFLEKISKGEVLPRLREAVENDEALYLALMLFDPEVEEDLKAEAAAELEALLQLNSTQNYVQNILLAQPLPPDAPVDAALRFAAPGNTSRVAGLLQKVIYSQSIITEIREAWERIPEELFPEKGDREHCRVLFVRQGLFFIAWRRPLIKRTRWANSGSSASSIPKSKSSVITSQSCPNGLLPSRNRKPNRFSTNPKRARRTRVSAPMGKSAKVSIFRSF